ncbi:unnamed protein product [Brachionus calyciflorus]|uniref:Reverse transcriptase domain-containing protein n=1 Tax=Brachionus calyciflorus TaxID=104777 RepID=A0A813Q659_9BILA|nr:unnamed protein product [Brachionus calyciflorus]
MPTTILIKWRSRSANNKGIEFLNTKIDIISYADDLIIFSNNKAGLQESLDIVSEFGKSFEVKFNPDKTVFMTFNSKTNREAQERRKDTWEGEITLDGTTINKVKNFKYLGVELNEENNDKDHIAKRKKSSPIALSKIKSLDILNENTNGYLKGHLYKTFIMSVLYYGAEVIINQKQNVNKLKRID